MPSKQHWKRRAGRRAHEIRSLKRQLHDANLEVMELKVEAHDLRLSAIEERGAEERLESLKEKVSQFTARQGKG